MKNIVIGLLFGLLALSASAESYKVDASHAQIVFSIEHLGLSTTWGRFNEFSVELDLDTENLADSNVSATINAASVDLGHQGKDDHIRNPDFFDVDQYATMTFASTGVTKTGENTMDIAGDLTMLGVTKPVTLKATVNKIGPHPFNKKPSAGFTATTVVKRSDFGMDYLLGPVGDEVKVEINIEASKG